MTYVVRIREAGEDKDWSFGFETPITSFTFVDLKPDTEYELQVRTKNAAGEGVPAFFSIRTDPAGDSGNVVPFPTRTTSSRIAGAANRGSTRLAECTPKSHADNSNPFPGCLYILCALSGSGLAKACHKR